MALELSLTSQSVTLDTYLDAGDELQIRHASGELAEHEHHVVAISEAFPVRYELLRATALSYEDSEGAQITVDATDGQCVLALGEPTQDPLELTVMTQTTSGETKKKKIYIEAKPIGGLPDRAP